MESFSVAHDSPVARRQVGVSNSLGLHLRVADKFVTLANSFQSDVSVHCKDIIADGKSVLSLLCLAAECGTMLALEAQGCDAEDAVTALIDDNYISPPRQLQIPTSMFNCSDSFLDQSCREISL
jgi:phosphocarrier protein HPr